jgi:hypothetical protein
MAPSPYGGDATLDCMPVLEQILLGWELYFGVVGVV